MHVLLYDLLCINFQSTLMYNQFVIVLPVCKVKWKHVEGMWRILHGAFWKFSKLSNSGISLNWFINDEVATRNTTAYFLAHSV